MFWFFANVSGLRLVVKGKAECKWSESRGSSSSYIFGKQKYLESVTFLLGSEHGEPTYVPIGVHTYNFACLLPENIPSSIEGTFGSIRYKVEATLDIPWDLDLRSVKPFTVVRHDDLNLVQTQNYRLPCETEEIKTFCCLFCELDPVIMTMRLPKCGFGLGETIPVHVEVVNKSTTNIMSTEFHLKKIEDYHASEPFHDKSRTCSKNVASKNSHGVARLHTKKFNEKLKIPDTLPTSNDRLCAVFQVKYAVVFKAYPVGLNTSFDIEAMITIGKARWLIL